MTPKKNSLQTWSLWGSELSLLLLLWKLVKETGTQIDVSICFTEYSQLSSLAAELWTPCCPLFFNSACMTTWMNIPLGTGFDTHTHTEFSWICGLLKSVEMDLKREDLNLVESPINTPSYITREIPVDLKTPAPFTINHSHTYHPCMICFEGLLYTFDSFLWCW